jgi:uncharacterized protein (DUF4415 family)
MSENDTKTYSRAQIDKLASQTDWERVHHLTDDDIERAVAEDPDTFIPDEDFWKRAKAVMPTGQTKELISIRLDPDIIAWFKKQGKGYQSRINAVLRAYVDVHSSAE